MAETPAQLAALRQFSDQLASVVEHAARSIVTVAARPRQPATGTIWRADTATIILTADHVIERKDEINVTLPDTREVKAHLIGRDPGTDLAALRLPDVDLSTEHVAADTSEHLRVGHLVLAIGRPTSDGLRVSFGAVSAIDGPHRSWQGNEREGVIYPDVTLYPGFSGGPLVDLSGRVVGLNSSQLTRQPSSALPVATLRRVANALVQHGYVPRGYLGVGTQQAPLPAALAHKVGSTQQAALLILTVEPGSPAEQAGLMMGDLLVSLGSQPTTDGATLRAQLGAERLGQMIPAKILRGGEPRDITITVAERSER
jgi:S1-C subfamily serine protease